ncbi:MAG: outer membrane lipid asymmetry maintenance protein MlaD [Gammaproteobacteria bacterium]|nr:MAG: outer membrane lipid asymmetry maintenance protein MlaD [Gammaproteobacteria bacterium]TDJ41982.1 MAG: outer membrane lipid asymmetry maintenance protein MlaD [Gammaproteobacteria bacterium]
MRIRTIEISVGAFLVAGALALVFLVVRVSGINPAAGAETYTLHARFDEIAGLSMRAKVSMAGVTIGRVTAIEIDSEYGEAIVSMAIDKRIDNLSVDAGARIQTEGILGGRYVSIVLGAEDEYLVDGDTITETQGAFVLENLIGELVTRMGN